MDTYKVSAKFGTSWMRIESSNREEAAAKFLDENEETDRVDVTEDSSGVPVEFPYNRSMNSVQEYLTGSKDIDAEIVDDYS